MPITSMDGLIDAANNGRHIIINKASISAVAGRTISLASATGTPTGIWSETTTGKAGVFPFANNYSPTQIGSITVPENASPAGGYGNIVNAKGVCSVTGIVSIYHILWGWQSQGTNLASTSWSPLINTAVQGTSGAILMSTFWSSPVVGRRGGQNTELWLETLATGGTPVPTTCTVSYTNSGTTANRLALLSAATGNAPIASSPVGTIQKFVLSTAGGSQDLGVESVQSIANTGTWTAGTFRLQIVRVVAEIPCVANVPFSYNAIELGMPSLYTSFGGPGYLGIAFTSSTTTTGTIVMSLNMAQDG